MGHGLLGSTGLIAGLSSGRLEEVALGSAVGLALVLLGVKAWYSHDFRIRKASAGGYHQHDVAHYTPGGVDRPAEPVVDPKSLSTCPFVRCFVPAEATERRPGGSAHPDGSRSGAPAVSSHALGTFDPVTNIVPAFDTEEAWRQRPPTPLPSAIVTSSGMMAEAVSPQDVPDLPVDEDAEEIPPPAGALPLLDQPPPSPPPGEGKRHSSAG